MNANYEKDDSQSRDPRVCRSRLAPDPPYFQLRRILRSRADSFRRPARAQRRYRGPGRGVRNASPREYGDRFARSLGRLEARRQHGQHAAPQAGRIAGDDRRYGHHAQRDERQPRGAGEVPADLGHHRRRGPYAPLQPDRTRAREAQRVPADRGSRRPRRGTRGMDSPDGMVPYARPRRRAGSPVSHESSRQRGLCFRDRRHGRGRGRTARSP